jgi:hypothetical protein
MGRLVLGAALWFVGFCLSVHVVIVYSAARWGGGRRLNRVWDALVENWMFVLPAIALTVVGYRLMIGSRAS